MSVLDWLEEQGFTPEDDEPIYGYAARWMFNNQFMVMEDPAALFATSSGVIEYRATGRVSPEDD